MPIDVIADVLTNVRLSSDYNVITFDAATIARTARPGQFVMVKTSSGVDPMLRRPFSIFEVFRDADGRPIGLSLMNKRVGVGTNRLFDARAGDRMALLGPLGQPFEPVDPPAHAWMVAGGVGLAPFATLGEALAARQTPMTLFYGARSSADLYYASLFDRLGARLVLATEDGTVGTHGRVTAPLTEALASRDPAVPVTIYACGPTPMMRAVAELGAGAGVPVFVSLEPVMGCGMGGCYSCVVPIRHEGEPHFVRACLDGPVFDAADLVWSGIPH